MDDKDPFAELEYKMNTSIGNKPTANMNDVVNRNANITLLNNQPVNKAVQLKAENYDLWFQNENLTNDNNTLRVELSKLQEKHDKLMYLARNRLGEIRTRYTRLEQDNLTLRHELEKLIREYENSKKIVEEYRKLEEKFKISDRDMRIMIDTLTRNNEELKTNNQNLVSEVELLREKYFLAKQNLEKSIREAGMLKDELTKTLFSKDSVDKELARLNGKLNEVSTARKAADEKCEYLNGRVNNLNNDLRKSEANAAMLHERYTLLKTEKESLENDSKTKITSMLSKLKELQVQNKTFLEQLKVQSKQCENLNEENKQLLNYINGYRKENDLLAKQLSTVNTKQKRLALELEKLKSVDQFMKNEEAIKMNESIMQLTDQLNQLRKMHANTLSENQRIKELLIEKDSVLSNLGYERHQLQDQMIKNQHTIAQLERMLKDNQRQLGVETLRNTPAFNSEQVILPEI
jgi:chromosome segregation ATPase